MLHDAGLATEIWGNGKHETLDTSIMKEEKDAKVEIYDYAAKFGLVPRFSVGTTRSSRLRKKSPKLVEVTISMPEQDILVAGSSRSEYMAEVAAAIKFKQEAEKYQAKKGANLVVVKDSSSLSTSNARSFFEFYKLHNRSAKLTLQSKTSSKSTTCQAMLDGMPIGEQAEMTSRKKAEDVAYLIAALHITKQNPKLLSKFLRNLSKNNGQFIGPMHPVDMNMDEESIQLMRQTLVEARKAGLKDGEDELESEEEFDDTRASYRSRVLTEAEKEYLSKALLERYEAYQSRDDLEPLRKAKSELPMNQYRSQVLDIVANNMYCIIIGATGSGKTTQVPQIVLDDYTANGRGGACNVICTQPRKIAATSIAKRVADERAEVIQDSVGYHVRGNVRIPRAGGSINYCTTGILLQQLRRMPDEIFDSTSHIIIDEVHERDILIDFLMLVLKKTVSERISLGKSVPKVVLMSATIDSEMFSNYFSTVPPSQGQIDQTQMEIDCPTLSVPGRTFPVQERYMETILETLNAEHGSSKLRAMSNDEPTQLYFDAEKAFSKANPGKAGTDGFVREQSEEPVIEWKREKIASADGGSVNTEIEDALVPIGLVATTVAHIAQTTKEGAILVFLPGYEEIKKVKVMLVEQRILGLNLDENPAYRLFTLHSSIAEDQIEVFNPSPPGCRKIILATNIAETSVTIPDVQYVVDTGKIREKRYDQVRRITKLQCTWISKSNAKQRAGRAGRVQDGHYYALYPRSRYDSLRAIGLPELLRSDLSETCLDVKAQKFQAPIREFLAEAIEPPPPAAVDVAVENLKDLACLTEDEKLTALGRLLASLPIHPALGKMIVLGVIFRCLDAMIILGAGAEERSLFAVPPTRRSEASAAKKSFMRGGESDHVAFVHAFRELRYLREKRGQNAMWDFAQRNYLHYGAFRSIEGTAQQIETLLVERGLIPPTLPNRRVDQQYGDPALNANSSRVSIIKALAVAGLYPNIAVLTGGQLHRTAGEKNILMHPGSVNAPARKTTEKANPPPKAHTLYTYGALAKANDGKSMFIRDTTRITPLMACLFGGYLFAPFHGRIIEMDDWLPFYVKSNDWSAIKTIMEFRKGLERMQTDAFRDLSSRKSLAEHPVRSVFAQSLLGILESDARVATTNENTWDRVLGDWKDGKENKSAPSPRKFAPPKVDSYRPGMDKNSRKEAAWW